MNVSRFPSFPAKLLLFGEYSVLEGGQALAVPFHRFSGALVTDADKHATQEQYWLDFSRYLQSVMSDLDPNDTIALQNFRKLMEQQVAFDSSIPIGFGLGSSGVLVAAIYHHCFTGLWDLGATRKKLSILEAFFHGKSSGLDPLVSYTQKPVLRIGEKYLHVDTPGIPGAGLKLYLINSGEPRHTGTYVTIFQDLYQDEIPSHAFRELVSITDHAIHWFLLSQWERVMEATGLISGFQWRYFQPMIHDKMKGLWKSTLEDPKVIIKLCGAGGGGYYLLFTTYGDEEIATLLESHALDSIPVELFPTQI